jgi:hypothetical protein
MDMIDLVQNDNLVTPTFLAAPSSRVSGKYTDGAIYDNIVRTQCMMAQARDRCRAETFPCMKQYHQA